MPLPAGYGLSELVAAFGLSDDRGAEISRPHHRRGAPASNGDDAPDAVDAARVTSDAAPRASMPGFKKSNESSTTSSPSPSGKTLIRLSIKCEHQDPPSADAASPVRMVIYTLGDGVDIFQRRFFVFRFGCFMSSQSRSLLTVMLHGTRALLFL